MAEFPPPTDDAATHHETVADHLTPTQRTALLHTMMRRQAALGAGVAAIFLALILGLPLVNWLAPEAANAPAPGGFTWTWLFLGILFYPITMLLSAYFVRTSDRIEAELVTEGRTLLAKPGEEASR